MSTQPMTLPYARPAPPPTSWLAWAWLSRCLVAAVFLLAAYGKISDPLKFAEEIQNYRMVPIAVTHLMAFTLPWIELAAAVLLVLGPWRAEARFVLFALLGVFTVAKAFVEIMGYPIGCGCFGGLGEAISKATAGVNGIILNAVLLGLLALDAYASARTAIPGHAPARSRGGP